jgi:hypothetical protein
MSVPHLLAAMVEHVSMAPVALLVHVLAVLVDFPVKQTLMSVPRLLAEMVGCVLMASTAILVHVLLA